MDPRAAGRRLRIISIVDDIAVCATVTQAERSRALGRSTTKPTRIAVKRLKPGSNGYRLVEPDEPQVAQAAE